MNNFIKTAQDRIKSNFRSSTLSYIFIILYINIFQTVLGPENSIVGVIFAIMMSASMVRDLTATPLRHLLIQTFVLVWMALAAFWVTTLSAPLSFIINFITLLMILYAFTYEYSNHMYFPYILSYLFLIFISPVNAQQLPRRILGMLVGAVSIMLYQWFKGRNRVVETARDVLSEMIDDICLFVSYRLGESAEGPELSEMHRKLSHLSQTVYDRRKKVLCISDASFSMIDVGRGLEHVMILIYGLSKNPSPQEQAFLWDIADKLKAFRAFLQMETDDLPPWTESDFTIEGNEKTSHLFCHTFMYIRDRMLHMKDPQNKTHYRKTALSLKVQIQAALDLSPVRIIYTLRVALLLACATLLVQTAALPHGKWLLFTLASVSLPYADDVPGKIGKRIIATLTGGFISFIYYSLIPSPAGRTVAMMLSGYISYYFTDYKETFACSTIGALGGAVFMEAFGFQAVGSIFIIRVGYVLAGAMAGYIINCLFLPYTREKATGHLWEKYRKTTDLLANICIADQVDTQLYYSLVIQAYLLEEKLTQNAHLEEWTDFPVLLSKCQIQVFKAHRKLIAERADAPVFDASVLL